MELWQKIVKIHDIVGTKPIDMACCISQMRDNKLGRLRKFHDDTLISSRKFKQLKVRYYIQQRVQHHKGHFQGKGGGGGKSILYFCIYTLLFPAVLGYPRIVTASLINFMIL